MGGVVTKKARKAPSGLSRRAQGIWRRVVETWDPEGAGEHHFTLFEEALRSLDRADQARKYLDEHGLHFLDRFEQPKERPEASIEHRHRNLFRLYIRDLELDADIDPDDDGDDE